MSDITRAPLPPGTVKLSDDRDDGPLVPNPTPTNDVNDPLNWSKHRKVVNFGLVLFFVAMTFVLNSIFYVGYDPIAQEIGMSYDVYNISLALQYAGLAIGCILFLPLAYRCGRRPIYLISLIVQLASAVWSATIKTDGDIIGSNIIMGLGGAIAEGLVQITITDMFFVHQYATMNGLFLFSQGTGAFIGPVVAGFIVEAQGWRWMFWWCVIIIGSITVLVLFFYEETVYTPVLDGYMPTEPDNQQCAPSLDIDSKKPTEADANGAQPFQVLVDSTLTTTCNKMRLPLRQRLALVTMSEAPLLRHAYQPLVVLVTFPAVAYAALTYGSLLAVISVTGSLYSALMVAEPWNFTPVQIGLLSISSFLGSLIGTVGIALCGDWLVVSLSRRNGGIYEAEMRLWPALPGCLINVAGMLMAGLGLAWGSNWLVIAFGQCIISAGFCICADTCLSYVADVYSGIFGDALVSIILLRNGLSVIALFALTPWVDAMGVQNLTIVMTVIAFVILLIPVALLKWGKAARVKSEARYRKYCALQAAHR